MIKSISDKTLPQTFDALLAYNADCKKVYKIDKGQSNLNSIQRCFIHAGRY